MHRVCGVCVYKPLAFSLAHSCTRPAVATCGRIHSSARLCSAAFLLHAASIYKASDVESMAHSNLARGLPWVMLALGRCVWLPPSRVWRHVGFLVSMQNAERVRVHISMRLIDSEARSASANCLSGLDLQSPLGSQCWHRQEKRRFVSMLDSAGGPASRLGSDDEAGGRGRLVPNRRPIDHDRLAFRLADTSTPRRTHRSIDIHGPMNGSKGKRGNEVQYQAT